MTAARPAGHEFIGDGEISAVAVTTSKVGGTSAISDFLRERERSVAEKVGDGMACTR
jgi:hypothetical protein